MWVVTLSRLRAWARSCVQRGPARLASWVRRVRRISVSKIGSLISFASRPLRSTPTFELSFALASDNSKLGQAQMPSEPTIPRANESVVVRPASDPDISSLVALHQGLLATQTSLASEDRVNPAFDGARYFRRRLGEAHRTTLVAVGEGELIGYVDGFVVRPNARRSRLSRVLRALLQRPAEPSLFKETVEAYLANVVVTASWRRRGVGRVLVLAFSEKMREAGAEMLSTDLLVNNDASKAMFASCGLDVSAIRMACSLDEQTK